MNNFTIPKVYDASGDLSKQWYVFYHYKNPETGKMVRFRVAISRSLLTKSARYEKANEIKADLKKSLLKGFNPFEKEKLSDTNLIQALELVSQLKQATLSKRSKNTYKSIVGIFTVWLRKNGYEKNTVGMTGRNLAEQYLDSVIINENLSNRTINNRIRLLRTVFHLLLKRGYCDINPFSYLDYLPEQQPPITAFTNHELKLIKKILPEYKYGLFVAAQMIFYCFIRPAELVRLQFKDVMWDHGIIAIPGSKSKNGNSQVIVMPDALKENLSQWDRNFPLDYYLFSNSKNLTPGTKEIAPTRIAEVWREFAQKHGITKNIYDLKHTGNGFAFDAGLNARDIQLQNRHHSLEQTQQYLNKFRRQAGNDFKVKFKGF